MKKLLILLFVLSTLCVQAQHYEILHVEDDFPGQYFYCFDDDVLGFIIYGERNCDALWYVSTSNGYDFPPEWNNIDSLVIPNPHHEFDISVQYNGCEISMTEGYLIVMYPPIDPFTESIIWKRPSESIIVDAESNSLSYLWSTGEDTHSIEVSEPGVYSVTLTTDCGSATYSVEVRDNVELYRATCDLLTNKNQVTWLVTPEQAEYITAVKIYRNTNDLVATVPYADGSFIDDIGSEATQWQYHLVGVSVEGDDCPIPSYWKRTIHLDRVQGSQGNQILQWTPYEDEQASNSVTAYNIYDVVGGEPRLVIQVGSFTSVYAYNPADFSGYGAVAAVFSEDKGLEEYAFSNRTAQMLDVEENKVLKLSIYPNPSNGKFTIEGTGTMTVMNTLGQTVLTKEIDSKATIELPQGMYFVKLGNEIRKIVME